MDLNSGHVITRNKVTGIPVTDVVIKAIEAMAELGMEMQAHKPKTFDDLDDTSFDLIVSLSPEAQHRAVEMTRSAAIELEFWHVFDPSLVEGSREMRLDAYREVRDDLFEKIQQRFPVIPVVDT